MELVKLTHENMEKEHICCAISNNKDIQVMSKKNWLKDRNSPARFMIRLARSSDISVYWVKVSFVSDKRRYFKSSEKSLAYTG